MLHSESDRSLVAVASGICLVSAVMQEIQGDDVADTINGQTATSQVYAALIASEFSRELNAFIKE